MSASRDCLGVMIAKRESTRLPNKNVRPFHGKPMFEWNLEKLIALGIPTVFDSDSDEMLAQAEAIGAMPHLRAKELRGNDIPSVPIFEAIIDEYSDFDALLNVQANSPQVSPTAIVSCLTNILQEHVDEVLTCYSNLQINGSVWAFSKKRLKNYGDYYSHEPDVLVVDDSIDIHTIGELERAISES